MFCFRRDVLEILRMVKLALSLWNFWQLGERGFIIIVVAVVVLNEGSCRGNLGAAFWLLKYNLHGYRKGRQFNCASLESNTGTNFVSWCSTESFPCMSSRWRHCCFRKKTLQPGLTYQSYILLKAAAQEKRLSFTPFYAGQQIQ